jgi:hypothetical protein
MHVGRVDIENHTKSPEKNSNWKPFWG